MCRRPFLAGAAAGAAGTIALDIATYADMLLRGRPSSEAPAKLAEKLASTLGIASLLGDDDTAKNRRSGAGALLGYANGLGIGIAYGAIRPLLRGVPPLVTGLALGAAAMAASDIPMVKSGVTDPQEWGIADWLADIVPHAVYGLTLAYTLDALQEPNSD
jgi:hypothetical protein